MSALPQAAVAAVSRIEALLAEARRLAGGSDADETTFALAETERRYLPDTVDAYLAIPAGQRDVTADDMLVEQLAVLERATAQRLATLGEARRGSLAANGSFLAERFGELSTLPEPSPAPAAASDGVAPPNTLVRRFFADLDRTATEDPRALVALASERFAALLPALTTVKRGLFGGPPKAVVLDVPVGNDALRYALEAGRAGVETSCTKIVRGIAVRTERTDVDEWLRALFEDVQAYVERDRSTRERLATFFRS